MSSGLSLSGLLIQAAVGIAGGRGGWRTKRSGVADTNGYAAAVLDGRNLTVRGPYRRRPPLPTSMPKVPCSGRSPSRPRASSARPPATARARRCAARPAHAARRAPRRLRGVDIGGGGHARRHPRDHAHVTQFAAPSATWQSYARRPTGRAGTVTRDVPGSGDAVRARALPSMISVPRRRSHAREADGQGSVRDRKPGAVGDAPFVVEQQRAVSSLARCDMTHPRSEIPWPARPTM